MSDVRAIVGSAEEWIGYLIGEPRMTGITTAGPGHVALSVASRVAGGTADDLVLYEADPDGGFRLVHALRGATAPVATGPGGLAYLGRSGRAQTVHHLDLRPGQGSPGSPRRLASLPGRVGCVVWRADRRRLLLTALTGTRPPDGRFSPFAASLGVHTVQSNFTFGHARSGSADWQVWTLPLDGPPELLPLEPPPGHTLTGEAAWLDGGRVVAGLVREAADGSRRYGFGVWADTDTAPQHQLWREGHDLTGPHTAPDGAALALTVSSGGFGPDPLDHQPYVFDAPGLDLRPVPTDPDIWAVPACWLGPARLVSLAERHSVRHLVVHDLAAGSHHVLPGGTSVLAVAPLDAQQVVTVHSSVRQPPELWVQDLGEAGGTGGIGGAGGVDGSGDTGGVDGAGDAGDRTVSEKSRLGAGTGIRAPRRVEASGPPPGGRRTTTGRVVLQDGARVGYTLCEGDATRTPRGLIAVFHGGPTMSWSDWSWRWNPWPFVSAGYPVLLLEPPMSSGYGPAGQAVGWRAWGSGIAAHAERLVRTARERHGTDGVPLIAMGGSFGGYLALQTATRLPVDLVVTHAAPLDLGKVAYGSEVFWSWVREYGHPGEESGRYASQSVPLHAVPPTTRVLLSHGVHDDLVPCSEAVRAHRLLRAGGVDSELVLFRGEGHALKGREAVEGWYRWALAACARATADCTGSGYATAGRGGCGNTVSGRAVDPVPPRRGK